jgi:exopolysaccharide biosynthesis WecB/TagA/CpsF family protein
VIERVTLFGLPLDVGVTESDVTARIATGRLLMTYLNPLGYHIPRAFPDYPEHLRQFGLVICDGVGVQKAVKTVFGKTTPLISPDYSGIGRAIFASGARAGYSLCLVGGKPGITEEAGRRIAADYPGYGEITAFDGYGASLTQAREHVLDTRPDMVMIALGMGRQEAYLLDMAAAGWQGVGICVGGVLDKVARLELFYPAWSEKTNLRFLGRLAREPRRMSRRYFVDYQPFIGHYLKYLLRRNR